ncbi:sensor histidine kinase [Inconstantimicrobium mannanitabidum]|uniref:Uncharacterized protein n=1 Tax=Inconstantimicrobium mannanitabidum TaxID=1604901 RepID=A0ACB5RER0_9CLOT|nr:ATP-binding protein [Clostridium sp. TW13]GKX67264.1 hypothetical protein rsdtw13_25220 [Clostridium sp. TW13]
MNILFRLGTILIRTLLFSVICIIFSESVDCFKNSKLKIISFYLLLVSSDLLTTLYCSKINYNMIMLIVYYASILLILRYDKTKSFIISLSFMIISFAVNRLNRCIFIVIKAINYDSFLLQITAYDQHVFKKLIYLILLVIVLKYNKVLKRINFYNDQANNASAMMQGVLVILFIIRVLFEVGNVGDLLWVHLLVLLACMILLYIVFKDIKARKEMQLIETSYKVQAQQIKNMQEILSIVRKEKHDFANHIQVIQALSSMNRPGDMDKIKEYVSKISGGLHTSFKYLDTGDDYVDALVSIKSYNAKEQNIEIKLSIDEPLSSINIEEDELISIVGNLIDNGLQAFKESKDKPYKEIEIKSYRQQDNVYLLIGNNGDVIPSNIKCKIFNKGFSTKKKESLDHGYGLYITKQLVEKNKGNICVESTEEKTEFKIEFQSK